MRWRQCVERALVFRLQHRQRQFVALRRSALTRGHLQDGRQLNRQRREGSSGGNLIAGGKAEPPDPVPGHSVLIFEQERKRRALRKHCRGFDLEDSLMRFAVARMHAPDGLVLAIDRLRGGNGRPLIVVSGGAHKGDRLRALGRAIRRSKGTKFREMKVAIVPTARSTLGQPVIGQHLEPQRTQLPSPPVRGDDVGIAIGTRAADKPRAVRLPRQRRAAGRDDAHDLKRCPRLFLPRPLLLPGGNLRPDFRRVQPRQQCGSRCCNARCSTSRRRRSA